MMELKNYFEQTDGRGIMATADVSGRLTAAVYAKPHFLEDDAVTVTFIMADRLTHHNLQSNPHAVYLFMESGEAYAGKRLYLTKTGEEKNSPLIEEISRRNRCPFDETYTDRDRFLVTFSIDNILPLIGDENV
jgi:hypothetical protein